MLSPAHGSHDIDHPLALPGRHRYRTDDTRDRAGRWAAAASTLRRVHAELALARIAGALERLASREDGTR